MNRLDSNQIMITLLLFLMTGTYSNNFWASIMWRPVEKVLRNNRYNQQHGSKKQL